MDSQNPIKHVKLKIAPKGPKTLPDVDKIVVTAYDRHDYAMDTMQLNKREHGEDSLNTK